MFAQEVPVAVSDSSFPIVQFSTTLDSVSINLLLNDFDPLGQDLACRIFPNPVHSEIRIAYEGGDLSGFDVELIDLQGRTILEKQFKNRKYAELDLQGLQNGVYILRIRSTDFIQTFKFIKQ